MARGRNITVGVGVTFGVLGGIYGMMTHPDMPWWFALVNIGFNIVFFGLLGLLLWFFWRGLRWMYRDMRRSHTTKRGLTVLGAVCSALGGLVLLFRWLEAMRFSGWSGTRHLLGFFLFPGELLLPFIWWAKYGYVPSVAFWPWPGTVVGGVLLALGRGDEPPADVKVEESCAVDSKKVRWPKVLLIGAGAVAVVMCIAAGWALIRTIGNAQPTPTRLLPVTVEAQLHPLPRCWRGPPRFLMRFAPLRCRWC